MFAVECVVHFQDSSREDTARIFDTREEVLAWIEKLANGFDGGNASFRVFELGREITVDITTKKKRKPIEYEVRRVASLEYHP